MNTKHEWMTVSVAENLYFRLSALYIRIVESTVTTDHRVINGEEPNMPQSQSSH